MRKCKILILFSLLTVTTICSAAKWNGVDKNVVEKIAEDHGRAPWKPFINTDQGDLLLFVFLLAGAAGGFVAGYNYKKLFDGNKK